MGDLRFQGCVARDILTLCRLVNTDKSKDPVTFIARMKQSAMHLEYFNLKMKVLRSSETSVSVAKNYIRQQNRQSRSRWPRGPRLNSAASGITGWNPTGDMAFCLLWVLCIAQIETSATGWSLFWGVSYWVRTCVCVCQVQHLLREQALQKALSDRFHNLNRRLQKSSNKGKVSPSPLRTGRLYPQEYPCRMLRKKIPSDMTGDRSRDLPTSGAAP